MDEVRDYSFNAIQSNYRRNSSPLRIGDSFEDLKRKMLAYSADRHNNNSNNSNPTSAMKAPHRLPPITITDSSYIEGIALLGYLNDQLDDSRISETNEHFQNTLDLLPFDSAANNSSRSSVFLNTNSQRMLESEFDDANRSRIIEAKEEIDSDESFHETITKTSNDRPLSTSRLRNTEDNNTLFSGFPNTECTPLIQNEEKYENNEVVELNVSLPLVMTSLETSDIMSLGSLDLSCNLLDNSLMDISDIVEPEGDERDDDEVDEVQLEGVGDNKTNYNLTEVYEKDIEGEQKVVGEDEDERECRLYKYEGDVDEDDGYITSDLVDGKVSRQRNEEKEDIEIEEIEDVDEVHRIGSEKNRSRASDLLIESVLDSDDDNDTSILLCNNYLERLSPPPLLPLESTVINTSSRSSSKSTLHNPLNEFKSNELEVEEEYQLKVALPPVLNSRSRSRGHSISTVVVEVKQISSEDGNEYYSTAKGTSTTTTERIGGLIHMTSSLDSYPVTSSTGNRRECTIAGTCNSQYSEFDDIREER